MLDEVAPTHAVRAASADLVLKARNPAQGHSTMFQPIILGFLPPVRLLLLLALPGRFEACWNTGLLIGQEVATLVVGISRVAARPFPGDLVTLAEEVECLPQVAIRH